MATHFEYYLLDVLKELEQRGRLKATASETMKLMSVEAKREPYLHKGKRYNGTTYTLRISGRKGDLTIKKMPHKGIRVMGHSNTKEDLRQAARDILWHCPVVCHVEPGIPIYF